VAGIAYLWEFTVDPDLVEEFTQEYGPNGSWVALFRQAPGYVGTLLLRDSRNSRRFITIDRWESADAYRSFRATFSGEYAALDERCERLTARESSLGAFEEGDEIKLPGS
jgi:heme-degrading monooxygenase HmoA